VRLDLGFRVNKAITWNGAINERQKLEIKYQGSKYREEERKEERGRKKKIEKNIARVAFNQKQILQEKHENARLLFWRCESYGDWFENSCNLSLPKT